MVGNVPSLFYLFVNQRVVMLQRSPEAFGFQRRPYYELNHPGRMVGPDREMVLIRLKLILQILDHAHIFKIENRAVAAAERVDLLFGWTEFIRRNDFFEAVFGDIPQFVMLFAKQYDESGGLGIKG